MQADTDEFKSQFAGKNVAQFKYTKSGAASDEEIDALSGATITTNAVTNAVNAGLSYADYLKGGERKSNLRTDAWYVSDTCGYIISDQRSRYGTFYNLYSGVEQCVYLTAS